MELLAYRGSTGSTIEWWIATNYGMAQFAFRQIGSRVTINTVFESRTFGWLNHASLQDLRRNLHLGKMAKRVQTAGGIVNMVQEPSIEALDATWHLSKLVQNDTRANNAWCNLIGIPVGTRFEDVVARAEEAVAIQRDEAIRERAQVMAAVDEKWGMF